MQRWPIFFFARKPWDRHFCAVCRAVPTTNAHIPLLLHARRRSLYAAIYFSWHAEKRLFLLHELPLIFQDEDARFGQHAIRR